MKKILFLITTLLISFIGISQTNISDYERQVIVAPTKGSDRELVKLFEENNVTISYKYDGLGWFVIKLPDNETQDSFINKFKTSHLIKNIYKDEFMEYSKEYIPNDVSFITQWHLKQTSDKDIDADLAWDSIPLNNGPVTVAVFDGGIDITHEDLIGNIVTPFNAVTNLPSNGELISAQYDRHGTACSGTIAAVTNNGVGVASVGNNKVKVMPVNIMLYVTAGGQFGTTATIQLNAINAAMVNNCVAISMSYSGTLYSQAINDAFVEAKTNGRDGKGLFICASTGNSYSSTATPYPANYAAVYGIGATSSTDLRAVFSNYGNIVDIAAPGSSIQTTDVTGANGYTGGNYASVSGTSFSCPITAGAGALLIYKNPNLTEEEVMAVLAQTADKVGNYTYSFNSNYSYSTRCVELGYGRINLASAINAISSTDNPIDNPTDQHNFLLLNCSVSNLTPTIGSSITISTTQKTLYPNLPIENPILQYRLSNDNVWSNDDIIIGTDTSSLGNGVELENEMIEFIIPNLTSTGTKYILIRANYDNSVSELISVDNTCSVIITVANPGSDGLDLRAFWLSNSLTTCGNNTSIAQGAVGTTSFRFQNMGVIPINNFTAKVYWENCPWAGLPSTFNCVVSSVNYTNSAPFYFQPLQPNALTGTWQFTTCLANCGPSNNPYTVLNIGETKNLVIEIVTVNGNLGDDYSGNNFAYLPVTRISCGAAIVNGELITFEPDEEKLDNEVIVHTYTITGMCVDNTPYDQLASGIYIVTTTFPDGSVEVRKFFK